MTIEQRAAELRSDGPELEFTVAVVAEFQLRIASCDADSAVEIAVNRLQALSQGPSMLKPLIRETSVELAPDTDL